MENKRNIQRIDTYQDKRFSREALNQHGCFLVDNAPYEIVIFSDNEAIVYGTDPSVYAELIDVFRFYTPHITLFYDRNRRIIKQFPQKELFTISLEQIQPSQFYVDEAKITAISSFIHKPDDIIIQVQPFQDRYISLDGHTRLYYAVMQGWKKVRAVIEISDKWVYRFVDEAQKRNIYTPADLILVNHDEYMEKWNRFCDDFFAETEENAKAGNP